MGLISFNTFISKSFALVNYDMSKIKVSYIDIETSSENGFPDVEVTEEVAVSIKMGKDFRVYGCEL